MSPKSRDYSINYSIASVPLVMLIVRPLAGGRLPYYLVVKAYLFARPEAYQIVDTSEDARASR